MYLAGILFAVVILTVVVTFAQENKASNVMKSFESMVPSTCKVSRDGIISIQPAANLVVGDIVHLKAGDKIPADVRIIFCQELKVNNSALTGESEPLLRTVESNADDPLEATNLGFYSSLVTEGDGVGVVIRIGDNTVLGQIAKLTDSSKLQESPLTRVCFSKFFTHTTHRKLNTLFVGFQSQLSSLEAYFLEQVLQFLERVTLLLYLPSLLESLLQISQKDYSPRLQWVWHSLQNEWLQRTF